MKKLFIPLCLFLLAPSLTFASSIDTLFRNAISVTNTVVIPFLLGIAFLIFVVNAIRFFVIGGGNEDDQEKARALATYTVAAFVLIITFWGIVNMFVASIGLGGENQPTIDYVSISTS